MFSDWKREKAIAALVDEAQSLADKLETTKPHVRDSYAAAAWFWQVSYLADGQDLNEVMYWKPAAVTRFVSAATARIAVLRKARAYDSSDGLVVWLHTARAVTEPRIAPAVRDIWQHILSAGPNADAMAADLVTEAGVQGGATRRAPRGFGGDEAAS